MKGIKNLIMLCLSLIFVGLVSINVWAGEPEPISIYENPESGYKAVIVDAFDELGVEDEETLLAQMSAITRACNVAYVIEDIENDDRGTKRNAERYLEGLFGENSNSLIFYIDLNMLYIFAEEKISYVVTSSKAYSITDNAYRFAMKDDYYNCGRVVFEQVEQLIHGMTIPEPMKYLCNALLSLMVGALLAYLFMANELKIVKGGAATMFSGGRAVLSSSDMAVISTGKTRKIYRASDSGSGGHGRHHHYGGGGFGGGGHHSGGGHHR